MSSFFHRVCFACCLLTMLVTVSVDASTDPSDQDLDRFCDEPSFLLINDSNFFAGTGSASLNSAEDLVIMLDLNDDKKMNKLFSIALSPTSKAGDLLAQWGQDKQGFVIYSRKGLYYHELQVFVQGQDDTSWALELDSFGCGNRMQERASVPEDYRIPAVGIAIQGIASTRVDAGEVMAALSGQSLIASETQIQNRIDPNEPLPDGPLQCRSGGPGAAGCSQAMSRQSCSVTCSPPLHACCGMESGSYCNCVQAGDGAD